MEVNDKERNDNKLREVEVDTFKCSVCGKEKYKVIYVFGVDNCTQKDSIIDMSNSSISFNLGIQCSLCSTNYKIKTDDAVTLKSYMNILKHYIDLLCKQEDLVIRS